MMMLSISDPRPGREVGIDLHDDGTVTVVVRTPTKRAAATVPLADLIAALTERAT